MAKDCFTFKQFSVYQDRCAMKVGTDGTLLGAWAHAPEGKCRILDIGSGTGLIALMMAQRYPQAEVFGVDIVAEACSQAKENVNKSPFKNRVHIINEDIADYYSEGLFDAIVSNPPFFVNSLICPNGDRTIARHSDSLSYGDLFKHVCSLLGDYGIFSLVVPVESMAIIESEAALVSLFLSRKYAIKTTPKKSPKHVLLEFRRHPSENIELSEEVLETSPNARSEWYSNLTKDFYL